MYSFTFFVYYPAFIRGLKMIVYHGERTDSAAMVFRDELHGSMHPPILSQEVYKKCTFLVAGVQAAEW